MILEDVHGFGVPLRKITRPRKTEVKPFSFEERELEKKEKKKQEVNEKIICMGFTKSVVLKLILLNIINN